MNSNVLREYLVSLGFQIDQPGFERFKRALEQAQKTVEGSTSNLVTALVTGYAAIGAATIGMMRHVARADLDFQLFATRMFMSTDAAKKLKIATDALGYSLDEISWNPELLARYNQLIRDQVKLQQGLGPDFEKQMRAIRGIEQQFDRLKITGQYLVMGIVKDLGKAFGLDEGGLERKFSDFVDRVNNSLPAMSMWIADHLAPVVTSLADAFKTAGELALNMLGDLFGDDAIKGEISLEKIKKAVEDLGAAMKKSGEDAKVMFKGSEHYLEALNALSKGEFKRAYEEFNKGEDITTPVAPKGPGPESSEIWSWLKGLFLNRYMAGTDKEVAILPPQWLSSSMADRLRGMSSRLTPGGPGLEPQVAEGLQNLMDVQQALGKGVAMTAPAIIQTRSDVMRAVAAAADKYHIPREIALAVAHAESGFNPNIKPGSSGELGPMQLMPENMRKFHVMPGDTAANIDAGVRLLAEGINRFPSLEQGIAAYTSKTAGQGVPWEQTKGAPYVRGVEDYAAQLYGKEMNIQELNIYTSETPTSMEDVKRLINDATRSSAAQTKRNIAQQGGSR